MADSGTLPFTATALPRGSWPSTWPRRLDRSPITSPMKSWGVTTSTAITGSSSTGFARFAASLRASEPVDDHLQVQLAHAGDHGLAGLLVGAHLEGGVLLAESL